MPCPRSARNLDRAAPVAPPARHFLRNTTVLDRQVDRCRVVAGFGPAGRVGFVISNILLGMAFILDKKEAQKYGQIMRPIAQPFGCIIHTVMREDWPFDQASNVAAVTTRQVIKDGLPILRVTHYSDDHSWAFACGTTDAESDGRVIRMGEALEIDPTLRDIADLPPGWTAWRDKIGGAWQRFQNENA
jgi:hypothetical protein